MQDKPEKRSTADKSQLESSTGTNDQDTLEFKSQTSSFVPSQEEPEAEQQTEQKEEDQGIVKKFPGEDKKKSLKNALIIVAIILAGVATGYGLSNLQGGGVRQLKSTEDVSEAGVKENEVFGLEDEATFRDQAQGVLAKGGIDGEGSHHLLRTGGNSQNVYLTSSTVDLDLFIDHEVKVWGETFSAQKAGWLMDVGRVQVLKLNAEKPSEE